MPVRLNIKEVTKQVGIILLISILSFYHIINIK